MFQFLIALGRHRKLVLGLPLVLGILALLASYALPIQYKTTAIIAGSRDVSGTLLRSVAESDRVRDRVIESFALGQRFGSAAGADTQLAYERHVMARTGRDNLLTITVVDEDPAFAARLADGIGAETIKAAHERRLSATSQAMHRAQTRLEQLRKDSAAADRQLAQLGAANWEATVPEAERSMLAALADLQAEINIGSGRDREGTPTVAITQNSMLFLQERLGMLQRQLAERRSQGAGLSPAAFEAVKERFYAASLSKRIEQQLLTLAVELADEIKPVAPAPIPLKKDSPKRAVMAIAGAGIGLALAILIALGSNPPAGGPQRGNGLRALWQAWTGPRATPAGPNP